MRLMNEHHTFTGMLKDLSRSKHPANFLYDANNIRLSTVGDSTLLSVTNEKGSDGLLSIEGTYLGHCILNKYLVVFSTYTYVSDQLLTTYKYDRIFRIDLSEIYSGNNSNKSFSVLLYEGDLSFLSNSKILAVGWYENENIQKVYWIDGFNLPRIINIVDSKILSRGAPGYNNNYPWNDTSFDFIPTLDLNEKVFILKKIGANGMFAPGVILYAFTYYYTNGLESAIFYTSPLMYLSHGDRGAAPDDKVDNVFEITITGIDNKFDYLRIYSIQRTSIDGAPIAKRVLDIEIQGLTNNTAFFIDNGTVGDSIDPTELLYKGGDAFIPQTIELKDGTLFFGNIEFQKPNVHKVIQILLAGDYWLNTENWLTPSTRMLLFEGDVSSVYPYKNQLNSKELRPDGNHGYFSCSVPCGGFKTGNYYRLGVLFQDNNGKWTTPVFIDDYRISGEGDVEGTNDKERMYPSYNMSSAPINVTLNAIELKIPKTDALELLLYYQKVRPVVVFPNPMDRVVIHQGVACPTLYAKNYNYRSSWFFRPKLVVLNAEEEENSDKTGYISPDDTGNSGTLYYSDSNAGGYNPRTQFENFGLHNDPRDLKKVEILGLYNEDDKFLIKKLFSTFHSPDLVFDNYYINPSYPNTKYQHVGEAKFERTLFSIDMLIDTPTINKLGSGIIKKEGENNYSYGLSAGLFYEDWAVDDDTTYTYLREEQSPYKWLVYPWHRLGSLNNDIERPVNQGVQSGLLKKKVISNLRISNTEWRSYNRNNNNYIPDYIKRDFYKEPQLFNSDLLSILKVGDTIYNGNTDLLLTPETKDGLYFAFAYTDSDEDDITTDFNHTINYKIWSRSDSSHFWSGTHLWTGLDSEYQWVYNHGTIGNDNLALALEKDNVRIKYKSTPHLLLATGTTRIESTMSSSGPSLTVNPSLPVYSIDNIGKDFTGSYLPIIEIVRPDDENSSKPGYRSTMFGGTSMDAFKANVWVPCGEPVRLDDFTKLNGSDYVVCKYSYGDTYFQRWDCLKTYPFTNEDVNQIVEIGSFMLETYVNIDGRYDRNRGLTNNTTISPVNFNLLNPIYSQIDNFFSYKILDDSFYELNKYTNQIVWSKEKQSGADVDSWTNITLASSYDLDGTKGEITSIVNWKDKLLCFLNSGISQILFNSRVLIPTSDDNPIEITNSYKVDGYRYITEGVGCSDKWLIKGTPTGVYFIDSSSKNLYLIADELQNISISHNMASWFNSHEVKKLLYDMVHNDLYINYKEGVDTKVLYYSETLGQFVSFLDYKNMIFLESYNNNVFAGNPDGDNININQMFIGEYNNLFGDYYDWNITFISNGLDSGAVDIDKIFSTIDYRMDCGTPNTPNTSFTSILVDNEYQTTRNVVLNSFSTPSAPNKNLQKKFRTWRILIPRAKKLVNTVGTEELLWKPTNDRIRNQWCSIKLNCSGKYTISILKDNLPVLVEESTGKAILHDINVQYFI